MAAVMSVTSGRKRDEDARLAGRQTIMLAHPGPLRDDSGRVVVEGGQNPDIYARGGDDMAGVQSVTGARVSRLMDNRYVYDSVYPDFKGQAVSGRDSSLNMYASRGASENYNIEHGLLRGNIKEGRQAFQEGGGDMPDYFYGATSFVSPSMKLTLNKWAMPLLLLGGAAAVYGVTQRQSLAKHLGFLAVAGGLATEAVVLLS